MWYVKKHDNLYYIYRNMKKQKAFVIIAEIKYFNDFFSILG